MSTKQLNIQIWSLGHKSLIRMQAGTQQMKFKAIRLESETKEENVVQCQEGQRLNPEALPH